VGSEPSNDVDEAVGKQPTTAQRAWGAFNAQGGLAKILIGSATAALTALLIALPGMVSSWVGGSDGGSAVEGRGEVSAANDEDSPSTDPATPQPTPPPTTVTTAPDTTAAADDEVRASPDADEPGAADLDIEDVRMRSDETYYYLDVLLAPPSEEITVNHLGIAEAHTGLACTGAVPYRVELGDTAVGQTTTGDVTTFVFSQAEPGTDGETLVQGEVAFSGELGDEVGCSSPYSRFVLRPQLVAAAGQRVQLEARIPRMISYVSTDDGVTPQSFDPFPGFSLPLGGTLSIAVGTTTGECAWYPADLSQVDLPRIEPPTPDALRIENCPER
jgi:hypothetical protein